MNKLNKVLVKSSADFIIDEISTEQVENYAHLVDLLKKNNGFHKIEEIKFKPVDDTLKPNDVVYTVSNNYIHTYRVITIGQKITCGFMYLLIQEKNYVFHKYQAPYGYRYTYNSNSIGKTTEFNKNEIQKSECVLENGKIVDLYELVINGRYI